MPEILQTTFGKPAITRKCSRHSSNSPSGSVGTQIRVAAVVEDELDVRALFDKIDRLRQLARRRADVKRQSVIFERSDVLDESGSRRESVRFGVEYAAHAFQQPLPRDPVHVFAEAVVFGTSRRDDARNRVVVSPGQRKDAQRLLQYEILVNVGLDVNRIWRPSDRASPGCSRSA